MRYILFYHLFFCGIIHAQNYSDEISEIARSETKFQIITEKSARSTDNINLTYHRLQWEINPAKRYINGKVTSFFKTDDGNPVSEVVFDLSDSLTVDSVKGQKGKLPFSHKADQLVIFFSYPVLFDSLTVFYQGVPANSGFGSFEVSKTPFNKPIIWTLSEPYGAHEWWPCRQNLYDKIDSIDIIVNVPAGNKVASNGLLISEKNDGKGNSIFHWKHRYPIANYLIAIAVTDYTLYADTVQLKLGKMPIMNFVYPQLEPQWRKASKTFESIIQYFDSLLIPYPFFREKYGHAQFGWMGGMEHQTMSFMADLNTGLMVHELAHQWFGNLITCGSWKDIWLNEGFATYLTGLYYERFNPASWLKWKKDQIGYICTNKGGSVYVYDTTSVNRIFDGRLSYSKAAMVLNMLRREIGDSYFFEAINDYLANAYFGEGFAKTEEFKLFFEKKSGKNLGKFFKDWVYSEGYANIKLEWNSSDHFVSVNAIQKPSHPSVNAYSFSLPLLLKGEKNDTLVHFGLSDINQNRIFPVSFKVLEIIPDPQNDYIAQYEILKTNLVIPDKKDIKVFPNPFFDNISIEIKDPSFLPEKIHITDISGREINIGLSCGDNLNLIVFCPGNLQSGLYYFRFFYPDKTLTFPIVKI